MNYLEMAKQVFNKEIKSLYVMRDNLGDAFLNILDLISNCNGKIIFTGIGKPGHICRKLAATFSSLGTPSFFLHSSEAQHGDLGMISSNDIVVIISYRGESDEVIALLPNIKLIGSKIIAITSNQNSTLAKACDVLQLIPQVEEACFMKLAPTSSTTIELVYGDALAITTAYKYGFTKENFALFHPAGTLGKKLILKVKDIMLTDDENSVLKIHSTLECAIVEMSKNQLGTVCIIDNNNKLCGIITDGDLRRALLNKVDIYNSYVEDIMTKTPKYTYEDTMAIDALQIMKTNKITSLPVLTKDNTIIGIINIHLLMNTGLSI